MSNLDQILLRNTIAQQEEDRQFRCRLDEFKDQEQRTMWDFIHNSLRKARAITRNRTETQIDLERKIRCQM